MTDLLEQKDIADFLQNTLHHVLRFTAPIKTFTRSPQFVYAISLYASIIEYSHGCLTLLRGKDLTCLPPLIRSMLEAYVDLINVTRDAEYAHVMQATYLKDLLDMYKAAKREPDNPYIISIAQLEDLNERISSTQKEFDEAKGKAQKFGKDFLKISARFKLAGLQLIYPVIYKMLCQDAHNNPNSLMSRHLEANDEGINVTFFREKDVTEVAAVLDTMFAVLIESIAMIRNFFNVNESKQQFEELQRVVSEFKVRLAGQYSVIQ
jgi:hypothetical protein